MCTGKVKSHKYTIVAHTTIMYTDMLILVIIYTDIFLSVCRGPILWVVYSEPKYIRTYISCVHMYSSTTAGEEIERVIGMKGEGGGQHNHNGVREPRQTGRQTASAVDLVLAWMYSMVGTKNTKERAERKTMAK